MEPTTKILTGSGATILIALLVVFGTEVNYLCEVREISMPDCNLTKYYGLANGKCWNTQYGNKLCRSGWTQDYVLIGYNYSESYNATLNDTLQPMINLTNATLQNQSNGTPTPTTTTTTTTIPPPPTTTTTIPLPKIRFGFTFKGVQYREVRDYPKGFQKCSFENDVLLCTAEDDADTFCYAGFSNDEIKGFQGRVDLADTIIYNQSDIIIRTSKELEIRNKRYGVNFNTCKDLIVGLVS